MTLAFFPPWWVLIGLCGAALAVGYAAYARPSVPLSWRQRGTLTGLRVASLLILLVFLLRPVSSEPAATPDAVLPVLLDTSRSMRLADGANGRRIDQAVQAVRDLTAVLGAEFEVELLTFGDSVRSVELEAVGAIQPDAPRSDVTEALTAIGERYATRRMAGVVLLSDGGDTSGGDVTFGAAMSGVPVYALGVGASQPGLDVEVSGLTAGVATVEQSAVDIDVSVVSHGRGTEPVELRLLEDGRLVGVRQVRPSGDGVPMRAVFQVSPQTDAATLYTAEIDPEANELVTENNRRSILVEPPGRPRRVLLIEGAPGYEHSFLKRVWLADPGIELDAVVRKGQNDQGEHTFYIQGDPDRTSALRTGYPADRSLLFRYDAVILANIEAAFFRPDLLQMTADFVGDRGGGLLMLGSVSLTGEGLSGSPLEAVIPLDVSDRGRRQPYDDSGGASDQARLTDDGLFHPVTQIGAAPTETRERWEQLPALGGSVALGPAKPAASVLAIVSAPGGDTRPLVAVQRYGRGRSMVFTGEAAWRWKMLQPAADRTYDRFWGQTIRWLTASASEPVALTTTAGRMPGDIVGVDVYVRNDAYEPVIDAETAVDVRAPDGSHVVVRPVLTDGTTGHYTGEFQADLAGVYNVRLTAQQDGEQLGTAQRAVLIGGADTEFANPRLDAALLERIAEASGGAYLNPVELDRLPARLQATLPDRVPTTTRDLWHSVWSFLLVVTLLTTEWSLRRAWGLR